MFDSRFSQQSLPHSIVTTHHTGQGNKLLVELKGSGNRNHLPQQSPRFVTYTHPTRRGAPRSTAHHGLSCSREWKHDPSIMFILVEPSTSRSGPYVAECMLDAHVVPCNARFSGSGPIELHAVQNCCLPACPRQVTFQQAE